MKILVACEFTGIVSQAFRAKDHDVTSCDLLPSLSPGKHYQGKVEDILSTGFEMLIGFPPCTFLCAAQMWRLQVSQDRLQKSDDAIDFFKMLYNAPIKYKALENPIGRLNNAFRKPDQIITPNWFGSPYDKDICLWLVNLPPLIATCYNTQKKRVSNHVNSRMSQDQKSMIKSKFFPEVAEAMANQWG